MPFANLEDRALLHLTGADTRAFLQGLLTQDIDTLAPQRPLWAGLLSPQGKALFDMIVFDDGDGGVWLDCEAARADELARRLTMYRLKRAVAIVRSPVGVLAAWGESAKAGWPHDPRLAELGLRSPGYPIAGAANAAVYRAHRYAHGVPEGAADLGIDRTLWLEADAVELNGVNFTKGCYVGQENTARMHHRDRVRRRLLPVTLGADPGAVRDILAGERVAGELRGWAGESGIAWLRIEHAASPLTLGGAAVRVDWPAWLPVPVHEAVVPGPQS